MRSTAAARDALRAFSVRLAPYRASDDRFAAWQLGTTSIAYVGACVAAHRLLPVSYALTLACAVLAAGLLVRLMVFFHDLGHQTFFSSPRLNEAVGCLLSVLTLVPYHHWRRTHNAHHRDFGNLDRREPDYVTTFTVDEYLSLPRSKKLLYRLHHDPWLVLGIGGPWFFGVQQRLTRGVPQSWRRERQGIHATNLGIALLCSAVVWRVGLRDFVLVHGPIFYLSSTAVVWLFLVQHAFEGTWRARERDWSFVDAALRGSSRYELPWPLPWFTADLGLHHVHHLSPRIPNYHLRRCQEDIAELRQVRVIGLRESLGAAQLTLWDEAAGRMCSFGDLERVKERIALSRADESGVDRCDGFRFPTRIDRRFRHTRVRPSPPGTKAAMSARRASGGTDDDHVRKP